MSFVDLDLLIDDLDGERSGIGLKWLERMQAQTGCSRDRMLTGAEKNRAGVREEGDVRKNTTPNKM